MRTTLTIDDDVAATLACLRRDRDVSLKDLINEALRRGLRDMTISPRPREPFWTKSVDAGALLIPSIDNVAEVLAALEGEAFK